VRRSTVQIAPLRMHESYSERTDRLHFGGRWVLCL